MAFFGGCLFGAVADSFGGNAQPADIEHFEHLEYPLGRFQCQQQLASGAFELIAERRYRAARIHAFARLQQGCLVAGNGLGLKLLQDRAGLNDFTREQIGGAHQYADLHAKRGQRRCHYRYRSGGPVIVNTAGKQNLHGLRVVDGHRAQYLDGLFPKDEAAQRAGVSAAFAAFEDELAGAVLDELAQQAGGGDVQIGTDAKFFEFARLARPAAGNECKRRFDFTHHFKLLLAERQGHEAEQTNTPGPRAEQRASLLQDLARLFLAHDRQGNQRQGTVRDDRLRKRRDIADPGHRSLHDRIPSAMGLGERGFGRQSGVAVGLFDGRADVCIDGAQNAPDRAMALRKRAGQGDILSHRYKRIFMRLQLLSKHLAPVFVLENRLLKLGDSLAAGSFVNAKRSLGRAQQNGFSAVEMAP